MISFNDLDLSNSPESKVSRLSTNKLSRASPIKEIEVKEVESASDKSSSLEDGTTGNSNNLDFKRSKTRKQ